MRTMTVAAVVLAGVMIASSLQSGRLYGQPQRSIWSGVYTEDQARRGEELYGKWCSRCHGADLTGLPAPPRFPGAPDRTPELMGPVFLANYDQLSLCHLVERIRISMPQDRPGSLTRQDTVDVVAFMLFHGGFPLGRTALTTRMEELQEIRILAHRSVSAAQALDQTCFFAAPRK
jgi:S-disulfanyl-L-cysteine oxidoreductase SoxD